MWPASRYSTVTSGSGENGWPYDAVVKSERRALGVDLGVERLGHRLAARARILFTNSTSRSWIDGAVEEHQRAQVVRWRASPRCGRGSRRDRGGAGSPL
jgi:hypothetical protein